MIKIFRWKVLRWFRLGIVLAFIAMQFVPVGRSNPSVEAEVPAPANVRAVLKRACYDCHSNDASLVLPGGPPGRGPFGRGPRAAARVGHEDAA